MNYNLQKVRKQILNPDEDILPKVFWIKYPFDKEMEGINIITLPKDLRCFLVIFSLTTQNQSRQFAIALPGPSEPGIQIYDHIEKYLCEGDGTQFVEIELEHLPQTDYLSNKEYAFADHYFWQLYK